MTSTRDVSCVTRRTVDYAPDVRDTGQFAVRAV
jgi:hypothetical protein